MLEIKASKTAFPEILLSSEKHSKDDWIKLLFCLYSDAIIDMVYQQLASTLNENDMQYILEQVAILVQTQESLNQQQDEVLLLEAAKLPVVEKLNVNHPMQ